MYKVVVACLLTLAPALSFGVDTWTAAGSITAVYSHNGSHYVQTSIVDGPCGSAGRFWWPTSDGDAKDMYAMALTAFVAGKRIQVVHDPSVHTCANGGQLATYMLILD